MEETSRGKGRVKMSAETRVPQPQAKESLQPPEAGRGKEEFSSTASRVSAALPTPSFQDSGLQKPRITFFCFEPPPL